MLLLLILYIDSRYDVYIICMFIYVFICVFDIDLLLLHVCIYIYISYAYTYIHIHIYIYVYSARPLKCKEPKCYILRRSRRDQCAKISGKEHSDKCDNTMNSNTAAQRHQYTTTTMCAQSGTLQCTLTFACVTYT